LFALKINSQSKGIYNIQKDIAVTSITFSKSLGNAYKKSSEKQLVELEFELQKLPNSKNKVCYLTRHYSTDSKNPKDKFKKEKQTLDAEVFYNLVERLNGFDTDKINLDFNVADGIIYSVTIAGDKYQINLSDNWNDGNSDEYLIFCGLVWNEYYE
jgi:hypothetical protein